LSYGKANGWLVKMKQRPDDLPDYHNPPIDEVVIAVQFEPIKGFLESHIQEFWRTVRDDYPIAQIQPRLEGPIESLDEAPVGSVIQIPMGIPAQGRMWLINETDDFLIQVQNTRFMQNWRRRQGPYQHFELLHQMFWDNFRKFREYLNSQSLPQPVIQQVELTYLNWIPGSSSLADFFKPASGARIRVLETEREPQDQSWSARYLIPNDLELVQRLYVQCQPAIRTQPPYERGAQLALVFRVARIAGIEDSQVESVLDLARIIIVEAFTELTTESAQRIWDRFK
jgi:uncharacterized protein (TIGR04255 family)